LTYHFISFSERLCILVHHAVWLLPKDMDGLRSEVGVRSDILVNVNEATAVGSVCLFMWIKD